jgi:hypothetical protein
MSDHLLEEARPARELEMRPAREVLPPFGPKYPDLDGLAKFRSAARHGLQAMEKWERHRYGDAVEKAILRLQRTELMRCLENPARGTASNCASRTTHNTGEAIHDAVRQQQRLALLSYPAKARRARTPEQWRSLYSDAMRAKASTNGKTGENQNDQENGMERSSPRSCSSMAAIRSPHA